MRIGATPSPNPATVSFITDANAGSSTFSFVAGSTTAVMVGQNISVSGSGPQLPLTIGLSNSGNSPSSIVSVSSNNTRFSFSPGSIPFSIPPITAIICLV